MSFLTPILIVIIVWWVGTGVVLYLQQRIDAVRTSLIATLSALSLASLTALIVGGSGSEPWHSYLGFLAAIVLWGCIELSYYTGLIGGVHKSPCPENCNNAKRFRLALGASIWHEVSVLIAGVMVIALLVDAENPAGLYSFLVLWLMRWSAKLNLFLGVPNFNTDWFPKRLAYAHSYIRRSPVTLFFPISVLLASLIAIQLISQSMTGAPDQAMMTILPAILLILAILEHLFMALPIADSELWNRIFARDDTDNGNSSRSTTGNPDAERQESLSAQQIHARTHKRMQNAIKANANRPVPVSLGDVDVPVTQTLRQ